jgi:hypothetical protein
MTRQDFYDLSKIRFSVLFQTAHTVGHDLILLREDNFVDALTEPPSAGGATTVPAAVRRSALENAPVARKKSAARMLGRDKYVLGIDSIHTKRE